MKLFASDFDGTFYFNGKKQDVYLNNISSVKEFQKNHKFAVVTGRDANSIVNHLSQHNLKLDYIACFNGGLIYDGDMNVLHSNRLKIDFEKLMELLDEQNAQMISICSKGRGFFRQFKENPENAKLTLGLYKEMNVLPVSQFEELDKDHIYMASVVCDNETHAKEVCRQINELGFECSAYVNRRYIDVVGKDASKRKAVEMIASHAHIHDIYTIGDSFNDINMIESFYGFAVEDANDEVKKMAKQVVSSVNEAISLLNQHE